MAAEPKKKKKSLMDIVAEKYNQMAASGAIGTRAQYAATHEDALEKEGAVNDARTRAKRKRIYGK